MSKIEWDQFEDVGDEIASIQEEEEGLARYMNMFECHILNAIFYGLANPKW